MRIPSEGARFVLGEDHFEVVKSVGRMITVRSDKKIEALEMNKHFTYLGTKYMIFGVKQKEKHTILKLGAV